MTSLDRLVGMRILWEGEVIDWKIPPKEKTVKVKIENWIKRVLKGKIK